MRNPNRTTKPQRRAIRRYNPYAVRVLGVAEAARWHREGILLDEARGFDNILNDLKYGPVPLDLDARVTAALDRQRHALECKLGVGPGMLTPTSSNVNNYSVHERKLDLTAAVNARLNGYGAGLDQHKPEPPGPSECGHYEVVDVRINAETLAMPETWFAKYEAYRKGREAGERHLEWHDEPVPDPMKRLTPVDEPFAPVDAALNLGPAYVAWDGAPWRDPNEVDAVHAEAIENALNDDIDPGE